MCMTDKNFCYKLPAFSILFDILKKIITVSHQKKKKTLKLMRISLYVYKKKKHVAYIFRYIILLSLILSFPLSHSFSFSLTSLRYTEKTYIHTLHIYMIEVLQEGGAI